MKYHIYAKILGTFLPDKRVVRINNCKIEKGFTLFDITEDRPTLPTRMKSSEFHVLGQGVKNFIVYPQRYISARTFESEYSISTIIEGSNLHEVLEEAEERFTQTTAALSLCMKNTIKRIGGKRFKRHSEFYDFEIVAGFIKHGKELIRVKLPEPLNAMHNYFPENFSKGFVAKAKKYLQYADRDMVFGKGMLYLEKTYRMYNSGNFNEIELIINLLKSVELVSNSVGINKVKVLDKETGKMRLPSTKDLFNLAGSKLKVKCKHIEYVQRAWDARNKSDVAHYSYNPKNFTFLNYTLLDEAATDYLIRFYKYQSKISVIN